MKKVAHMYARVAIVAIVAAFVFTAILMTSMPGEAMAQIIPEVDDAQSDLVINEYMASNSSTLEDPDAPGRFPDWIELHNPTGSAISLDGLSLVKGEAPNSVTFAITDGLSIPAQGYLLFYADNDPQQGAFHTNFRLSKEADSIGLYSGAGGSVEVDRRSFTNQITDYSEGRDPDGGPNWRLYNRPTPGRSNSARPPVIRNVTHVPELPPAGVEIDVTAVISDEGSIVAASIVYSTTAMGTATVPMELRQGGNLFGGTIPAQVDGTFVTYYVIAEDNDGEVTPDLSLISPQTVRFPIGYTRPSIVINEVMSDNVATYEDPNDPGDFPDWIELHNDGAGTISLDGLYLSDNPDNTTKFAITDGLTIAAGGYILFLADEDPEQGQVHTNFKLNKDGERIALYGAEGTVIIDELDFNDMPSGASVGRFPDGKGSLETVMYCPTPDATNIDCPNQTYLPVILAR